MVADRERTSGGTFSLGNFNEKQTSVSFDMVDAHIDQLVGSAGTHQTEYENDLSSKRLIRKVNVRFGIKKKAFSFFKKENFWGEMLLLISKKIFSKLELPMTDFWIRYW